MMSLTTFVSKLAKGDESRFERRVLSFGSIISAFVVLGGLLYLHAVAMDIGTTPRIFPLIVIRIGIVIAALLVLKELVTRVIMPNLLVPTEDEVTKHLTGEQSQFSIPVRAYRLLVVAAMIAAFFLLANVSVLVSILVCYPATVYALGVRDVKRIVLSTVVVVTFVFVVFVVIIQMPFDLF